MWCDECVNIDLDLNPLDDDQEDEEAGTSTSESDDSIDDIQGQEEARRAMAISEKFVDTDSDVETSRFRTPLRTSKATSSNVPMPRSQSSGNSFAALSESEPMTSPPTVMSLSESMRAEQMKNPILRMAL